MNIIIENGIKVIYPSDNWLTNGETFSDKVYLGKEADSSSWRDATDDEYAVYTKTNNFTSSDEIDSETALKELLEVI